MLDASGCCKICNVVNPIGSTFMLESRMSKACRLPSLPMDFGCSFTLVFLKFKYLKLNRSASSFGNFKIELTIDVPYPLDSFLPHRKEHKTSLLLIRLEQALAKVMHLTSQGQCSGCIGARNLKHTLANEFPQEKDSNIRSNT